MLADAFYLFFGHFEDLFFHAGGRSGDVVYYDVAGRIMDLVDWFCDLLGIGGIGSVAFYRSMLDRLEVPAAHLIAGIRADLRRLFR